MSAWRRSRASSANPASHRCVSPGRSEAGEFGRSAAFFAAAVGLVSMSCCGALAVVFGSAAATAVSAALSGPLGPVVGALLLALDALCIASVLARRRRPAAHGRAVRRTAATGTHQAACSPIAASASPETNHARSTSLRSDRRTTSTASGLPSSVSAIAACSLTNGTWYGSRGAAQARPQGSPKV